ncbi:hypothetical protein D6C86_08232 [Aureobasidium pullulans]|uniref:Dystroglycan-type cadherin-like domain-containing protein n=1 Tax=Aureobasidium pullulans TaxID=5580 RepID=A0A4V4K725_AURPU|nr:hypothetical protein D6C94_08577 [Aureobasidium pullulans]THZ36497.1 hypothetical protein D6C87_09131 [Aureobasidium pullulans]THZ55939.1 hypothetical protein D6C86_08232 [Aureobasidium pullulans]
MIWYYLRLVFSKYMDLTYDKLHTVRNEVQIVTASSDVPSVARANEAYAFQLAPTTFVSGDGSTLVYSLLSAPAWLSLESTTRTLYGTPGQGNTGPNVFRIVATGNDGSANMDCTLVVASNRAPTLAGNISSDLARSGPLSGPTTLLLQPFTAFAITFSDDLFGDPGTIKSYYATMADRTPLPSWLKFDSSSLTFWGMTPVLVTGSQTYGVDFIASDVAGFAGATTTFSLLISSNQLAFDTQTENITVTPEKSVILGPFRRQLQINGGQISDSQIQRAVAKAPEWLIFQNSSLELTGTPPQGFESQTISITVTDTYGDTAVKNIFLRSANASLFDHKIGNLTATAGKPFSYTLAPSLFSQSDLNIELDVGNASSWLAYDASKRQLEGTPPATAKASADTMTLIASSASDSGTQTFFIVLKAAAIVGSPSTSQATTSTTPIPTSTSLPSVTSSAAPSKGRSMTAGIIIEKGDIRPIVPYGDQEPMMVEHNHDEEKFIGSPVKHSPDEPPQLEVDLPMPMQPPSEQRRDESSFVRLITAVLKYGPTLPPANTADNWTTTDTSSSLSRDNSDARAAAQYAEYAVEMELPRHQRTWVRPGEASPTPPPSSILRTASDSREAARRKWADRLNRNSSGNLASRSPSPLRVTLSGVSASGIKGRKQRLKSKFDEDKENRDEDQLSKLVSNDSFSGARQMRGRKSLVQVEAGNRISSSMAKVEETGDKNKANTDDTEWEDAVENVPQGHGISAGVLATSTSHAGSMRFL